MSRVSAHSNTCTVNVGRPALAILAPPTLQEFSVLKADSLLDQCLNSGVLLLRLDTGKCVCQYQRLFSGWLDDN